MQWINLFLLLLIASLLSYQTYKDWRKSPTTLRSQSLRAVTPTAQNSLPPLNLEEEGVVRWAGEMEENAQDETNDEREWRVERENERKRGRRT